MSHSYTPSTTKKSYNISESKLKRILEYNERLRDQLELPRITVSDASASLIQYCSSTKDPLIPSIWGTISKEEDPFALAAGKNRSNNSCCIVM